jgi:chromosome segregation ATPase
MTRRQIASTSADLETVRHELDAVDEQVIADSTNLAQETSQLQGVQKALTTAQANVTHQTGTIDELQTCLGGVEQSLNALAVGDQGRAIDALDAVATNCASAVAHDG